MAPVAFADTPRATPLTLDVVALTPMAMLLLAAAATDDWPPMAMESLPAAIAPAVALPPMAVAPTPLAVVAVAAVPVPPPPMAVACAAVAWARRPSASAPTPLLTACAPSACESVPVAVPVSASTEVMWRYFVAPAVMLCATLNSCEPLTASVDAAETSPSATPWIWRLPTATTPFVGAWLTAKVLPETTALAVV